MADVAADLRALDLRIEAAVSGRDAAALETLLADDYVYTHSTGNVQGKGEYIAAATGRPDPVDRRLSGIEAEVHGDIAITTGNLEMHFSDRKREPNRLRYLRVYRLRGSVWQPICHRTLPAAAHP